MTTTETRRENFERAVEDYDSKALDKSVDFTKERYLSVERDTVSEMRFVRGHGTLQAACAAMGRAVMDGDAYVPQFVLDLDTGHRHELDVHAFVVPQEVDAVAMVLPRNAADFALGVLLRTEVLGEVERNAEIKRPWKTAVAALERALKR